LLLYNTFSPKIKALWGNKGAIHPFVIRQNATLVKIARRLLWFRHQAAAGRPRVFMALSANEKI